MSDFAKDLAASEPIKSFKVGEIVAGTAIVANQKMILVDLDGQFTGIITGTHMHSSTEDSTTIEPGARIESIVIGEDAHSGLIHLSLRKASQAKLIEKLHSNFDTKEIITVVPNEANKGGLLIDLDGIKGFIPVSQLTPEHYPRVEGANAERILEQLNKLVGKPFQVRVINVDQGGKKIIFSEKAAIEEQRAAALQSIKVGDVVEGHVSGILTYGLFVTFQGIEGLVHVSEIDWGHVNNPHKHAKIGDKVTIQIIGIEGEKISLSIKRLKANPWQVLADKYQVGDIVEAPVLRLSQFGIFLELDGAISGLIHLSEIPADMAKTLEEKVHSGEMMKARIITFDPIAKRIGLSLKALDPNYVPPAEVPDVPVEALEA
ncbi:S1 RNA-binding domain-containing protein [Candidatus Gracilibacteria bacterium]|jgi:small subunit ribosomal protein S1|nr:S1 RNA-binding domain-containing protein [Candidatus Gracilibacteria bacterium]